MSGARAESMPALTARELFVLEQLAAGRTVGEIQPMLTDPPARGTTMTTPGQHAATTAVERLRAKLGARTHAQMVHLGHTLGLLDAALPQRESAPDDEPLVSDKVRRCEWCGTPLPEGSRPHRRTDSEKCRRALARSEAS